jgi:hypothetical protein
MIKVNISPLIVLEMLIWIMTGVFWHGIFVFSWLGSIAGICALMAISHIFFFIPISRPIIRWMFNAYSWNYLAYCGMTLFTTGLSSLAQALNDMRIIEGFIPLMTFIFSPLIFHACAVLQMTIRKMYSKIRILYWHYTTSNQHGAIFSNNSDCTICVGPAVNASWPDCDHITFCFDCFWTCWPHIKTACPACKGEVTTIKAERTLNGDYNGFPIVKIDFDETLLKEEINYIIYCIIGYVLNCTTCFCCFLCINLAEAIIN